MSARRSSRTRCSAWATCCGSRHAERGRRARAWRRSHSALAGSSSVRYFMASANTGSSQASTVPSAARIRPRAAAMRSRRSSGLSASARNASPYVTSNETMRLATTSSRMANSKNNSRSRPRGSVAAADSACSSGKDCQSKYRSGRAIETSSAGQLELPTRRTFRAASPTAECINWQSQGGRSERAMADMSRQSGPRHRFAGEQVLRRGGQACDQRHGRERERGLRNRVIERQLAAQLLECPGCDGHGSQGRTKPSGAIHVARQTGQRSASKASPALLAEQPGQTDDQQQIGAAAPRSSAGISVVSATEAP